MDERQQIDKALNNKNKDTILKKKGFNFKLKNLFDFYLKAKALTQCDGCMKVVDKSVNLNGFRTTKEEALKYCDKHFCDECRVKLRSYYT